MDVIKFLKRSIRLTLGSEGLSNSLLAVLQKLRIKK